MDFQTVRYAREGDVVTITLDRPDRLNALSEAMFVELGQALDLAVADGARAVVLTGAANMMDKEEGPAGRWNADKLLACVRTLHWHHCL